MQLCRWKTHFSSTSPCQWLFLCFVSLYLSLPLLRTNCFTTYYYTWPSTYQSLDLFASPSFSRLTLVLIYMFHCPNYCFSFLWPCPMFCYCCYLATLNMAFKPHKLPNANFTTTFNHMSFIPRMLFHPRFSFFLSLSLSLYFSLQLYVHSLNPTICSIFKRHKCFIIVTIYNVQSHVTHQWLQLWLIDNFNSLLVPSSLSLSLSLSLSFYFSLCFSLTHHSIHKHIIPTDWF